NRYRAGVADVEPRWRLQPEGCRNAGVVWRGMGRAGTGGPGTNRHETVVIGQAAAELQPLAIGDIPIGAGPDRPVLRQRHADFSANFVLVDELAQLVVGGYEIIVEGGGIAVASEAGA